MFFILILTYLILDSYSQQFTTGIIKSHSFYNLTTNNYTILANLTSNSDLIISMASYSSLPAVTSCVITAKMSTYANITCTSNVISFYYLYYSRTPMIYSNIYTYSFFEENI